MRILVTILICFLHLSVSFGSLWTAQKDGYASFNKSFTTEESGQGESKDPRSGDQESADAGENEDEACHRHALRPMLASMVSMPGGLQRLPDTFYRAALSRDIHKPPPESGI
jgi:hypothetical protein